MKKLSIALATSLAVVSAFPLTVSAEKSETALTGEDFINAMNVIIAENDIPYWAVDVTLSKLPDESGEWHNYAVFSYDFYKCCQVYHPLFESVYTEYSVYPEIVYERGTIEEDYWKDITLPAPRYLLGDLDDDGTVSAEDAQFILNAYAETLVGNASGLTEIELKAADPNGDGELSAEDAQYILLYYAANTLAQNNRSWVDIIIRNLL